MVEQVQLAKTARQTFTKEEALGGAGSVVGCKVDPMEEFTPIAFLISKELSSLWCPAICGLKSVTQKRQVTPERRFSAKAEFVHQAFKRCAGSNTACRDSFF